jgi:hypothetical protein
MDEKQQQPAPEMSLTDQEQARQAKLAKYTELGVDPFRRPLRLERSDCRYPGQVRESYP